MANLEAVSEGIVNTIGTYADFMQKRADLQEKLMMGEIESRRKQEYDYNQKMQEREWKREDEEAVLQRKKREYFMDPEKRLQLEAYANESPQAADMIRSEYGDIPEMQNWVKRYDEGKKKNSETDMFMQNPKAYVSSNIDNAIRASRQRGVLPEEALTDAQKKFKKDEWKQKKLRLGKSGIEYLPAEEQYREALKAYNKGEASYEDISNAFPDKADDIFSMEVSKLPPNEQLLANKISELAAAGDEETLNAMLQEMKQEASEYGIEPNKILGLFTVGKKKYPGVDFNRLFKLLNIE